MLLSVWDRQARCTCRESSGHPTGRRVTFTNGFAVEGHYFNFSTSGQWLWDELQIVLPAGQNPYPVADAIEKWFDETDVDGLNMPFAVSPGDFEDIADMLVPELTRRGRYKTAYAEGTLREKLFGKGRARLTEQHPATQYRPRAGVKAAE